jgi:hypothetical protein
MFGIFAASYIEVALCGLKGVLERAVSNPAFKDKPGA